MKFIFEKNLPHQEKAVNSIIEVLKDLEISYNNNHLKDFINPKIDLNSLLYLENIQSVMNLNNINLKASKSNIIDILMETGTGKTFTYTKAIFEINRFYGINKFIIIVPSLSIKAGVINFLTNEGAIELFKDEYNKRVNLYILESKKSNKKSKKSFMPNAIKSFVESYKSKDSIEVLLINQGMLNSDTLSKNYDITLFDRFTNPFEALSSINPVVIIDEPHRFKQDNKSWQNIKRLHPQLILRFGATFEEDERGNKRFENLIYTLTATEAFNKNLVKGVIAHIEKNDSGKNALLELIEIEGSRGALEAKFILKESGKKSSYKLKIKDSLGKIHSQISNLFIEKINKNEIFLSNGLILKKRDKLNPYSYSQTLEEIMIKKAIYNHFKIEKELIENRNLKGKPKIKPLTLFFIDNIDEYRNRDGKIKQIVEESIKNCIENNLKETNDEFYKEYLKRSLKELSKTHGGYFSKDNSVKDEEIEEEINEILHDKNRLLDLSNPRRFIFSKWTLKEGWDNPNIFQICKLRGSGSEISKLQEVGRGLRLPINEYGVRVKDEFFLHYFVDFTEEDFVDRLINEINNKSNLFYNYKNLKVLSDELIENIVKIYKEDRKKLVAKLILENIIDSNKRLISNGIERLKAKYPLAFIKNELRKDKIRRSDKQIKNRIKVRVDRYLYLKDLWEKINQKAILNIKIKNEKEFEELFYNFFIENLNKDNFIKSSIYFESKRVKFDKESISIDNLARESKNININNMSYKDFVLQLSKLSKIHIQTVHNVFLRLKKENILNISNYLNYSTLRAIKDSFDTYLLLNSLDKIDIDYKLIKTDTHPTKLTDKNGEPLTEIVASDIGIKFSNEKVAESYYFEELFYDSNIEKENIKYNDTNIEVFTKIPKNSIKIPIIGAKSYSPDFAYVIRKRDNGKKIYFVIDSKDEKDLSIEDKIKIRIAEKFFNKKIKILFKKQLPEEDIKSIIKQGTVRNSVSVNIKYKKRKD